jgi:hypothetical protein
VFSYGEYDLCCGCGMMNYDDEGAFDAAARIAHYKFGYFIFTLPKLIAEVFEAALQCGKSSLKFLIVHGRSILTRRIDVIEMVDSRFSISMRADLAFSELMWMIVALTPPPTRFMNEILYRLISRYRRCFGRRFAPILNLSLNPPP